MGLTIFNDYHRPISVAIMVPTPGSCIGSNFEMRGWWNASRFESKTVYSGPLTFSGRFWYYYAFATDGATWAGPGFWRGTVPNGPFELCYGTNVFNGVQVNFREIDINDSDDFALNITPPLTPWLNNGTPTSKLLGFR